MGDRLNVDWNVESPPAGAEMPLLMLQPLLENAIYHGIQPLSEGGTITVNVHFSSGVMEASIRNPSAPPKILLAAVMVGRGASPTSRRKQFSHCKYSSALGCSLWRKRYIDHKSKI